MHAATRYLASFGLESHVPLELVIGSLLQGVLADGPIAGLSSGDAIARLRAATGLDFDERDLRACAEKNPELGVTVTSHEPPFFLISSSQREETLRRLESAAGFEERVLREWAAALLRGPKAPRIGIDEVIEDFRLFLRSVAVERGVETVVLAYGDQREAVAFLNNIDGETWERIPERCAEYRRYCREHFPAFFPGAEGNRAAFIASVMDRTFELCRLNLAPTASKLLLANLSGLTLYLDTNVVFQLLGLHGPAAHLDVRRVLALASKAKAVARVTPRTLDEFESAAESAISKGLKFVAPEALLRIAADAPEHEFFAEYHRILSRTPLSKPDLLASVRNIDRTLEAFGVKVWTEKTKAVDARADDVHSLATELKDYYEAIQAAKPPASRKAISWEQAEHDAYHLELIRELRPAPAKTFGAAKFWFLTMHGALMRKSRELAPRNRPPACITMEQLHQVLRSVLPRSDAFDETFVRNLHSPLFQAHRANYTAAMQEVSSRLAHYRELSSEHFANIVADSGFMSRVACVAAEKPDSLRDEVSRLVDERLQSELKTERENRLQAARRAKEEALRAERAVAREQAGLERLKAVEERAHSLTGDLEAARRTLADLLQEKVSRDERALRLRSTVRCGTRIACAIAVCCALGAMWMWRVDGAAVRGTPLNAFAVSVFGLSLSALLLMPARWAVILGIGGLTMTVLQVTAPPTPAAAAEQAKATSPSDRATQTR